LPSAITAASRNQKPKKADVVGHPRVLNHVGLLSNEPPSEPSCSLFSHPTTIIRVDSGTEFIVNASPLAGLSYRGDNGTQWGVSN
jgi:hypothetical protein